MIITCPACSTRYMVEPPALGSAGRRVRCNKCGHSWMQSPPDDLPKAVTGGDGELRLSPAAARAAEARKKARQKGAIGWLVFLVIVGGGLASLYAFRQPVVDAWPPAARLYAQMGIKIQVLGEGLEIRPPQVAQADQDGTTVLTVSGEIINTTEEEKDVPNLRGVLLDADNHEIQHWNFTAGQARLLPGEIANFETDVVNPNPGAANIQIVFTSEPADS